MVIGADYLALKQPPAEFLANFRDTGGKRKPEGKLFSVTTNSPDNSEFAQWINDNIAEWQERQIAAGWSLAECKDYWKTTLFGNEPDAECVEGLYPVPVSCPLDHGPGTARRDWTDEDVPPPPDEPVQANH